MIAELLVVASALANWGQTPISNWGQTPITQSAAPAPAPPRAARPFAVGERATYEMSWLTQKGTGSMEVVGIDTIRGRPAFHFRYAVAGKASLFWKDLYSIVDTLNSWADTATMHSLRSYQDQLENKRKRIRRYEIFPETKTYTDAVGRKPSVDAPLDDLAMMYVIRGKPLEVGQTLKLDNYFKPASNPILIRVVKRDTLTIGTTRRPAIVVQPRIGSSGTTKAALFSEDADTHVWFSDDSARVILQIQFSMPVAGKLTMKLKSYRAAYPTVQNQR